MKKLLSLIGAISVVGSGASAVVACGDDSSSTAASKLTGTLESKLKGLALTPAKKASKESALTPAQAAQSSLAPAAKSGADAIKNKITETHLGVPADTNPDTTNSATIAAIRTALRGVNPKLTASDVADITFKAATLQLKKAVPVEAIITYGTGDTQSTATVGLQVTLGATDQQRANEIKAKIINPNLVGLPAGTPTDTTNPAAIAAMKTLLQKENPTLTADDLAKIIFSQATLKDGTAVAVEATITVNSATASKGLTIVLDASYQQQADAIVAKITNPDVSIGHFNNPSTANQGTISTLRNDLQKANPMLLDSDLPKITFATTTLQRTISVPVTTIVTYHGAVAQTSINVTLTGTDQQQVDAVKKKIVVPTLLGLPVDVNTDTSNPDTIKAIKADLQTENPTLTSGDLATMTFAKKTLLSDNYVTVPTTITIGTAKDTVNLSILLAPKQAEQAVFIAQKITSKNVVISGDNNPSTINPETTTAIRNALKAVNPRLIDADLAKITFSNATLKPNTSMHVDARVTVGDYTSSVFMNVTLGYSDQQQADAIYAKIPYRDAVIPASSNPSTANPDTVKAIRTALMKANPALTADDASKITFGNSTLQAGRRINLGATITVGSYKKPIYVNITLDGTDQQYANGTKAEVTTYLFDLPHGTNPDTTNAGTIAAIKKALRAANPMLTADAVTHFTFAKANLAKQSTTSVKTTITFGDATASLYLTIGINPF